MKKSIIYIILFVCLMFNISSVNVSASDIDYSDVNLSDLDDGSEIIKYNEDGSIGIFESDADKEVYEEEHSSANEERKFLEKYRTVIIAVSGFALITMILVFIVMCAKLGALGENPISRKKVIAGLLVDGLCIAALGSLILLYGIFYGFFNSPEIDSELRGGGYESIYINPNEDPSGGGYVNGEKYIPVIEVPDVKNKKKSEK